MSDLKITMGRNVGSYNWANPSQKQAQIHISFPVNGKIEHLSACVEPDGEYDLNVDGDTLPEDVISAIQFYYEKLWISTDKERVAKVCKEYFANKNKIDLLWYEQRIEVLRKSEARIYKQIQDTKNIIECLEEEIEQEVLDNSQFGVGA